MPSFLQAVAVTTIIGILSLAALPSAAQTDAAPPKGWPHLLGNYKADLTTAIQQRLVYPPEVARDHLAGYVYVSFKIEADGSVKDARIHQSLQPDCDGAALCAVRQLPPLEPLREAGKPIASYLTTIIKFDWRMQRPVAK